MEFASALLEEWRVLKWIDDMMEFQKLQLCGVGAGARL